MSHDSVQNDPNADPPPLEEELVAYLDGELDQEATRRVEQRLAADPDVRETLRQLQQTWEMLDGLGTADLDGAFTQTTLEMVAVEAEGEVRQVETEVPQRRRRRILVQVSSLVAAALAGFLAVTLLSPDPNRRLLEDLPVLESLDEYQQVRDIEFLKLLQQQRLFGQEEGNET